MRRATIVGTSTLAGLAAVLLLNPAAPESLTAQGFDGTGLDGGSLDGGSLNGAPSGDNAATDPGTATAPQVRSLNSDDSDQVNNSGDGNSSDDSSEASNAQQPSAAPQSKPSPAKVTPSKPKVQTVTGRTIYTAYGPVQVSITVSGGTVSDVHAVQLPTGDGHSYRISQYAGPQLRKQAIAAKSARIAGVSGATYTSDGYSRSLASALAKAGIN